MGMKRYRINEIFHSLQGEGYNTGRAAVFIRFAGCNMRCPFCDTEFDTYTEMTSDEIIAHLKHIPQPHLTLVVMTGGEPTLQADTDLVGSIKAMGFEVAMESNGSLPAPENIDWLTLSPKVPKMVFAIGSKYGKELKLVFTSAEETDHFLSELNTSSNNATLFFNEVKCLSLQPCDTGDAKQNAEIMRECIDYIKRNPRWRLSLQTHKLVGIK